MSYRIPEVNLDGLKARIAKMNKRAVKLGMEPIVVTETGENFDLLKSRDTAFDEIELGYRQSSWVKVELLDGETTDIAKDRILVKEPQQRFTLRRFVLCEVEGKLPRVNGWAMRATIQHEEGGNILRTVPGFNENLPLAYRTATTNCEHCGKDRRRNDTYVLQRNLTEEMEALEAQWSDKTAPASVIEKLDKMAAGEWKQVGRNCLADFIRSGDVSAWAQMAEMLAGLDAEISAFEEDGWEGGGSRGAIYYSALELLTQVACCVRNDGFCSRTEAKNSFGKQATADHAMCFFDSKYVNKLSELDRAKYSPNPADKAKAAEAIAWAQELPADVTNDYLWNIRVVSHRENLTHRDSGLAASIISAYHRHMEKELQHKYERETSLNEHFGTVGERKVFTLTVMGTKEIESHYGLTTLYKFRDSDGRTAIWFASGEGDNLEIGGKYTIKATVKAHRERDGWKETQLNRVQILLDHAALDACLQGEHPYVGPHYFSGKSGEATHSVDACTACGEIVEQPRPVSNVGLDASITCSEDRELVTTI